MNALEHLKVEVIKLILFRMIPKPKNFEYQKRKSSYTFSADNIAKIRRRGIFYRPLFLSNSLT